MYGFLRQLCDKTKMKDLTSDVLSQQIVITCRCLQDFRPLLSPCPAPEPTAKETITIPQEEPTPAREPLIIVSDWILKSSISFLVGGNFHFYTWHFRVSLCLDVARWNHQTTTHAHGASTITMMAPTDSNSNGSYYYSNDNGSTYYNSGNGSASYTPPSK